MQLQDHSGLQGFTETSHSFLYGSTGKEFTCNQETQEMWVQSLGQEDTLEEEMTTPSSILAWGIPWIEEPAGLQSMGLQRIEHN